MTNPNPRYYRQGNTIIAFDKVMSMTTKTDGKLRIVSMGATAEELVLPLEFHKEAANAFEKWLTEL